jgi:glycosyltransferase involved in cell wall biosynthesis
MNLKILFISSNPYGLMGTSGTYNLAESYNKYTDFYLMCRKTKALDHLKVCNNTNINLIESDRFSIEEINQSISKNNINIVIFSISSLWLNLAEKIKRKNPKVKIVLDIKTPWLKENNTKQFKNKAKENQKFIDLVITPSFENIATWIDDYKGEYIIYPLGVKLSDYNNQKFVDVKSCRNFVYIGQIHEKRNLLMLVEYINRLPKNIKNNCTFDFYGQGPLFNKMVKTIKNKELSNIINMKGIIESNKISNILSNYDAGIAWVPTKIYNNSPSLKLIEYISSGIYPITTDTKAHKEFSNIFDFSLFQENKNSFRNAIEKLYNEGIKKEVLIKNFESIKEYDWDVICKNILLPSFVNLLNKKSFTIFGPRLKLYDSLRCPEIQMSYKKKYLDKKYFFDDNNNITIWYHYLFVNDKVKYNHGEYSIGPNIDFNTKNLNERIKDRYIVADSQWMKNLLINDHNIDSDKIDVIPVYVGEEFYKCKYERNEDFIIGLIGYIDHNDTKNLKSLLKICKKTPEIKYQLLSSRNKKELKILDSLTNLDIIKADRKNIINVMKKWSIFLGLSKSERGPASLQECKTIGIPTICPDHTGYSEFNSTIKMDIEPFKDHSDKDIDLIIDNIFHVKENLDYYIEQEQENRKWFWHTEKKPYFITKKWDNFFDKCLGI